MRNPLIKNCCDGMYNSFDVHFTADCDNKCAHCIDMRYSGGIHGRPDAVAIAKTIIDGQEGFDDVLFLGGEPCLYLPELLECVRLIKAATRLEIFVTTAVPKTCSDNYELFREILHMVDGINLSVQHSDEDVADRIRKTTSKFDRQLFYNQLPCKEKIRINLNIVKPYLFTREGIEQTLRHYSAMGFNSIKLSEIQHGVDCFVSFEDTFGVKLGSPYTAGCQTYLNANEIFPGVETPILLKRSCFLCEDTLKATVMDGVKAVSKLFCKPRNKYAVVYSDGTLTKQWR